MPRWRARSSRRSPEGSGLGVFRRGLAFRGALEPRLDGAGELDGQRLALAVDLLAERDADPAFGDRIFLDVVPLDPLEADADAALEHLALEVRAVRIDREAVGRSI